VGALAAAENAPALLRLGHVGVVGVVIVVEDDGADLGVGGAAFALYLALLAVHPWLFGVSPMGAIG
jgi:hypothetical protein